MARTRTDTLRVRNVLEEIQDNLRINPRLMRKERDLNLRLQDIKQQRLRLCFTLSADHYQRLKMASHRYGYPMSALIQAFIDMYCP